MQPVKIVDFLGFICCPKIWAYLA